MGCERVGGVEGGIRLLEFACETNDGVRDPVLYHIKINKYQFYNRLHFLGKKHRRVFEESVTFITTGKFRTS